MEIMTSITNHSILNNYTPPTPPAEIEISETNATTPPEEYDQNFCLPIQYLRSDKVELRPFVPSLHSRKCWEMIKDNQPDVMNYLSKKWDFPTEDDLLRNIEKSTRRNSDKFKYAIYSVPLGSNATEIAKEDYVLVGLTGIIVTNLKSGCAVLGPVIIDKVYRRTHVQTHQAGLILKYLLDPKQIGGQGFRRVEWLTLVKNESSRRAAKRLGFKEEGILRTSYTDSPEAMWDYVPKDDQDIVGAAGSTDIVFHSITVDDWVKEVRERVIRLMESV